MKNRKEKFSGIAGLFEASQLRTYFINYIYFILGVELLILLMTYFGSMRSGTFPVEFYFLTAFTVPLAITILMGILVVSINKFLFGENQSAGDPQAGTAVPGKPVHSGKKLAAEGISNMPVLLHAALLIGAAFFFYRLDDITGFILHVGGTTGKYLLISVIAASAGIALFGVAWLLIGYRLRRKEMDQFHRYRQDAMERLGLLILDDSTVIDREGRVLAEKASSIGSDRQKIAAAAALPWPSGQDRHPSN
jgi:hypothetical protein